MTIDEKKLARALELIDKIDVLEQERQLNELKNQLVVIDHMLVGNTELANRIAPRAFGVVRRHAFERVPGALVADTFRLRWKEHDVEGAWRQLLHDVRPATYYASMRLQAKPTGFVRPTRFAPGTVDDVGESCTYSRSNLPRDMMAGLPFDWEWLVLGWHLEARQTAGWDLSSVQGHVQFQYNNRECGTRPLSDVVGEHDQDLFLHMRENLAMFIDVQCDVGPRWVGSSPAPSDAKSAPLLYLFLHVIERWHF